MENIEKAYLNSRQSQQNETTDNRDKAAMNFIQVLMSGLPREDDKIDIFITNLFYQSNEYSNIAGCSFSFGRDGARRLLEVNKAFADLQKSIGNQIEYYKILPHSLSFDDRAFNAFIALHNDLGIFDGKIENDNKYVRSEDDLPETISAESSTIRITGMNYIIFETWENHVDNKIEIEISNDLLEKIANGEFEEDNIRPEM